MYVKDCLWYANDGAHYLHARHVKRSVPFGTSSLIAQEGSSEPVIEPGTEPIPESETMPSSIKCTTQPPRVSDAGKSGSKEVTFNVDLEQMKISMREAMKDELSDLVKTTMKDEISILQRSNIKKLEAMELEVKKSFEAVSEIKKNYEKMLTETHHYTILYDEFSARVKQDLSNNVIAFDKFVSQVRKIGDSVTILFKTLDSKIDKTS